MNIGEVAKLCDLSTKALRYYEEVGLVAADRHSNGYRSYSSHHIEQLRFVLRARNLGFDIESCRGLVQLHGDGARASADVKQLAKQHLAKVEEKILELDAMHKQLSALVDACHGDNQPECPILENLAHTGNTPVRD